MKDVMKIEGCLVMVAILRFWVLRFRSEDGDGRFPIGVHELEMEMEMEDGLFWPLL